jgi:DNA-directed RNA polymerase III subunit RPC5
MILTDFCRFQSVMDFDHDSDDLRPDDERSQISDTTPPGSDDSPSDSDNSDDPVVREVEFLINEVPELKHLLVFQWAGIEKGQPLPKVSEVRVKWESGFVEVDVPIPRETLMSDQYDRVAAIKYGEALRKTKELGQTAYGAAAGFERKLPPPTKRKGAANDEDLDDDDDDDAGEEASTSAAAPVEEDDNIDKYLANYEDAIDKGHVLQTTTWEGRLRERGEGGGFTMVGVLRDNLLHFNMVHAYVQLHPSMQHLDALNHLELNKKEEIVEAEPQQDGDEDEEDYDAIPVDEEWVEAVFDGPANEPWERYPWVPEESEAAYASFESRMFLADEKQTLLQFETVKSYSQRMLPRVIPRGRPVQEESESESESETEEEVEFPERWEKTEGKGKGKAVEVEEEEVVEEEEQVVPAPAESVS